MFFRFFKIIVALYVSYTYGICSSTKNISKYMIQKIGTVSHFYPKHYLKPNRFLKKVYKVKQHKIPRFLYINLLVIIPGYALYGVIAMLISIIFYYEPNITRPLYNIHIISSVVILGFSYIAYVVYKKK